MAKGKERALSVRQLLAKKFKELVLPPEWRVSVGMPELGSVWLVWGGSGHGKTSFVLKLCKALCSIGLRVAYDTMEEGYSKSFADALRRNDMDQCGRRFLILDNEPLDRVAQRMKRPKSPDVLVIDSMQYSGMKYRDYKAFKDMFRHKMIIIVSHANGNDPKGQAAEGVRYDCSVKIRVEGYKAFITSRYGGGEPFVIWRDGALKYWGE